MEKLSWRQFENELKKTCITYRLSGDAVIQQISTPVVGDRMKQSTVDFSGVYGPEGHAIAFDAKQCGNKTSFPLSDIRQHQYEFLRLWNLCGGDAYFFIQFTKLQDPAEFFKTPISFISEYWDGSKGRKSIPYKDFKKEWVTPIKDFL